MIYTKKGDDGTTGLCTGERVAKYDERIEVNGEMDEVNAWLGLIRSLMSEKPAIQARIEQIQCMLMSIMTAVASSDGSEVEGIGEAEKQLETDIDALMQGRKFNFVVPGANPLEAQIHIARSKVRTVERRLWKLRNNRKVSNGIMTYLNRLSDYLFALAVESMGE